MKFFLSLLICLLAFSASAGTVHPRWNFTYPNGQTMGVREFRLQTIGPYGVGEATNIITADYMSRPVSTLSSLVISNLPNGRSYRITYIGPNTTTVFTNSFSTNVTGLVLAGAYIAAPINDRSVVSYSQTAIDAMFAAFDGGGASGIGTAEYTFATFDTNTINLSDFSATGIDGAYVWEAVEDDPHGRYLNAENDFAIYFDEGFVMLTNAAGANQVFAETPEPSAFAWPHAFPNVWQDAGAGGTLGSGNWDDATGTNSVLIASNAVFHVQGSLLASNLNVGVANLITNVSSSTGGGAMVGSGHMLGSSAIGHSHEIFAPKAFIGGGFNHRVDQVEGAIIGGNNSWLTTKPGGSSADGGIIASEFGYNDADAALVAAGLFNTNRSFRATAIIGSQTATLWGGVGGSSGHASVMLASYESQASLEHGSLVAGKWSTNIANGHNLISLGSENQLTNFNNSVILGHKNRDNNGGVRTFALGWGLTTLLPDTAYLGFYGNPLTVNTNGTVTAVAFVGDGSGLTALNGDNISSGTVADARIASTIARDSEVTSAISALSSVYQPLDADLTTLGAGGASARTFLGLGTGDSPTFTGETLSTASLGTTPANGLTVINTTAAAAGAQQVSPPTVWTGNGWKTTSTAASQPVDFRAYVLPVQGSTAPTAEWKLQSQINAGGWTDRMVVTSGGDVQAGGFTATVAGNRGIGLGTTPAGDYSIINSLANVNLWPAAGSNVRVSRAGGPSSHVGGTVEVDTTQTGNVGAGEDTLQSFSVPAAQLSVTGDFLEFRTAGTLGASANNKRIRVKFGAATIMDTGALAITGATSWVITGTITRTGATTQKCEASITTSSATLMGFAGYATATETLSGAVTFLVTGEATDNNDIVKETFNMQWMPNN